jgi:hypothetical protein
MYTAGYCTAVAAPESRIGLRKTRSRTTNAVVNFKVNAEAIEKRLTELDDETTHQMLAACNLKENSPDTAIRRKMVKDDGNIRLSSFFADGHRKGKALSGDDATKAHPLPTPTNTTNLMQHSSVRQANNSTLAHNSGGSNGAASRGADTATAAAVTNKPELDFYCSQETYASEGIVSLLLFQPR